MSLPVVVITRQHATVIMEKKNTSTFFSVAGTPLQAVITSDKLSSSTDSYHLTWQVQTFGPILETKIKFRSHVSHLNNSIASSSHHISLKLTKKKLSSSLISWDARQLVAKVRVAIPFFAQPS